MEASKESQRGLFFADIALEWMTIHKGGKERHTINYDTLKIMSERSKLRVI